MSKLDKDLFVKRMLVFDEKFIMVEWEGAIKDRDYDGD